MFTAHLLKINDNNIEKGDTQEMKRKFNAFWGFVIILTIIVGCGSQKENNNVSDTEKENNSISDTEKEIETETSEHNKILNKLEVSEEIEITSDSLFADVSIEEVLKSEPKVYERYTADGFVFEWLVSDYENKDNEFLEDAVLIVSKENQPSDVQIIYVEGEAAGGTMVSSEDRFLYEDVNFDQQPDLLVCSGNHGTQGALTYYCFLQTDDGFVEEPEFTNIANPIIDTPNKLILSLWRNSAASHSWAEYEYKDGEFVKKRTLTENVENEVSIWDVDGKVIGRSDQLTEAEIDDLIYNEKSDWGIEGDRWKME